MAANTDATDAGRKRVAYRCGCGYVHENSPSNWVNVAPGDHCVKCGRQFAPGDRYTRRTGDLFPWDTDPSMGVDGGDDA